MFDLLTIAALAGGTFVALAVAGVVVTAIGAAGESGGAERSGRTAVYVAGAVGVAAVAAVAAIVATARSDRNLVRATLGRVSDDSYVEYVAGVVERFAGDVQTVADDRRAFAAVGAQMARLEAPTRAKARRSSAMVWTSPANRSTTPATYSA